MKKTKKSNFLEWNNHVFISSIKKINFLILLIIVLDAFFYFSISSIFFYGRIRLLEKEASISLPNLSATSSITDEQLKQLNDAADATKSFKNLLIFSILMFLIIVVFLASIIKGIIWAITTKAKITFSLISKFLALNLIWMSICFGIIFMISNFIQIELAPIFMLAALTLLIYLTNTLYTLFMKHQKLKSIFSALKLNVLKIHLFLLPYLVVALLFLILFWIGSFFKFNYAVIAHSLILITYIAFVRYYVSTLVFEIEALK